MIINRLNYELFLVDYLDGNLDPSLVGELLIFLEQNPDIKNAVDGIENSIIEKEIIAFPNKSSLKKKSFFRNGIDDEDDYLCISSIEKTQTAEETALFKKKLFNDKSVQEKYSIYKKTILQYDNSLVFNPKASLKRVSFAPIKKTKFRLYAGIAASVALLVGLLSLSRIIIDQGTTNNLSSRGVATNQIVRVEKEIEKDKVSTAIVRKTVAHNESISINSIKTEEVAIVENADTLCPLVEIPKTIQLIEIKEIAFSGNPQQETIVLNRILKDTYSINRHLYATNNGIHAKEIGVFEVIQYGVRSIGSLVGSNMQLSAKRNKKGKIKEIHFESRLVAFSTPVKDDE